MNHESHFNGKLGLQVLVATAKCPGFTPEQVSTTRESLRNLKDWLSSNREWKEREFQVTWRLTGELAQQIDVPNAIADSLLSQLERSDLVITTPSTLMLEAMLMDIPVILLNYHSCPVYVPAAWQLTSSEHMQPTFESLFDNESQTRRLAYQRAVLKDHLAIGAKGFSATEKFCELAESMLVTGRAQIDAGETLLFDKPILERSSSTSDWDQAAMFPRFEEFENNDYSELQSELAHSRREIDLLHREIAQIRSELGEAHKIFDQIHQHPIAGPVVRIRQRILDWLQRRSQQDHSS